MTDDDVIKRAQDLCDRGSLIASHRDVKIQRLKRIVDAHDELEARYMVPALLELIERRGLR